MLPIALTIAGSDPGGGAGIQADLKTFHQFGVYGTSAITLITVQNTTRMSRVQHLAADLIAEQIAAIAEDFPPQAAKTGALGTSAAIHVVASSLLKCPLIVDPVMIGKHGGRLLDAEAIEALKTQLLPVAALVTPNIEEASLLSGIEIQTRADVQRAAERIAGYGARAVLIKGGHLEGDAIDTFWQDGRLTEFRSARIDSRHTHGTGCTLSAAITARVAQGDDMATAVAQAKAYLTRAIETAPGLGAGTGPLNHWAIIGISSS